MKGAVTILGGGVAGLAAALYLSRRGVPVTLLEASAEVGGLCRTIHRGDYAFDTGAHRLHDRDAESTDALRELLGEEFRPVSAPTQIHSRGRWIDFPLSPWNLMRTLGPIDSARAAFEVAARRLVRAPAGDDFASYAHNTYGPTLAGRLLLNYSEKLWGLPGGELSREIAHTRLKGLDARTFFLEAVAGRAAKTRHLDGAFLYPDGGIGRIPEALAASCPGGSIVTGARVTAIRRDGPRVTSVVVNGREERAVETIISTLPLPETALLCTPSLDEDTLRAAGRLRFRSLVLVALFLTRDRLTPNASLHYPDPDVPFTRVYEPKNRSARLAPAGRTVVVGELPCAADDAAWKLPDGDLAGRLEDCLALSTGLDRRDVEGSLVVRLSHAYPVLGREACAARDELRRRLAGITNLVLAGRNGLFEYRHIHDLMRNARRCAETWS